MEGVAPLPEILTPLLRTLEVAFPAVPTGEERRAVLAALLGDMSEGSLAALAGEFFDDEPVVILDEAIHAVSDRRVAPDLVQAARDRLAAAGWPFDDLE
jgi:hypothetical protein